MAFSLIAFISPNYRDNKNEWLKAYEPGTTTPKAMALDSGGVTQVAKLQLNADGFLVSAGDALVIPYIDGSYDLWLFPTEAEADANNTANAIRLADDINSLNTSIISDLSQAYEFDDVDAMTSSSIVFPAGKKITVAGNIIKNDGGGADWESALTSTVTPNGTYIRQSSGVLTNSYIYRALDSLVNIDCFRNNSLTDDVNILSGIELAQANTYKKVMCTGNWSIPIPNRAQGVFSGFMTWNYSMLIDGYNGEIDFSGAKFTLQTNSVSDARMTMFVFLNSSSTFSAPEVDGQLNQQFMGVGYIDDCIVRVGGGCKNLSLILDKDLINFGGHGIVVRNYGVQDGFVDVEAGVPVNIRITGKGEMSGMWQSGIVPITGYDIVIKDYKATYSGSNLTFNSQQSTTGHNFHQEAVSNGTNDPFIRDVAFKDCTAEYARQHGFMIHTAINNTRISGGWSRFNGQNGARYEGFCQSLDVDGLVIEDNVGDGEFISLSTAGWLGSEGKDVVATIRSTVLRSGGVGKRDNSGGASLQISGYSAYNQSHGVILAQAALPDIRQLLRDIVIENNCADMNPGYGVFAESAVFDNVLIVNQDGAKYNQTPINFNGDQPEVNSLIIDGDLPTGFEFDTILAVDLPVGSKGLRLYGSYATILNDRILFAPFPGGVYTLPRGYGYYRIDRQAAAFPVIRVEEITASIVGEMFVIDYIGSANTELRTRDGIGTINGAVQPFTLVASTKYQIEYETTTNILVTVIP
jgi:hypothetical protein